MTEFERGVRFALERTQKFTDGVAEHPVLQFGAYVLSAERRDVLEGSAEHREKIIKAMVYLGQDGSA